MKSSASEPGLTPHTVIFSLKRSNSYAMLMRLIFHRRFCVGTVPYNRFSRMFARKYNNDSNLFIHAQIRPTLFLKIFNEIVVRCYSSTERLLIACVSWKPRKFKLPGWLYEQFWRSEPVRLTNSMKRYHASTLIAKRARNLRSILASWPTDVAILLTVDD